MTTITREPLVAHPAAPHGRTGFWAETGAMTRRNLLRIWRTPNIVLMTLMAPLVFVVLFDIVFGGSIATGDLDYIDFLIPGVLVQTAVFDGTGTAIALTQDLERGSLDRFRSLPMRRSAVLIGRTTADLLRLVVTAAVVLAIGFALGFRPDQGPGSLVTAVVLAVGLGHAFHWAYAWLGLKLRDPVAVESAGFLPILPLTFVSSAFAPVENMPDWLRPIAEHQPVTVTVDAVRGLIHGGQLAGPLVQAVLWIIGLLTLWSVLATRAFDRLS